MSQLTTRRVRRVAAIAAVATVGVSLAACSGGAGAAGAAQEPQTITFAINPPNNVEHYYQDAAAAFQKLHKGVKIDIQKLPAESYPQAIATRVQGGNAPDVFVVESGSGQTDSVQPFAKAGLVLPITDPAVKKDISPAGLDQYRYGGKIYAVPSGSAINGIVFNDEAAKQTGITLTPSSSFSDTLAACKTAESKGKSLFGLAGSIPANTGILALEIATSTVYGPDPSWNKERAAGKVKFATTKGWAQALNAIKTLYANHCFQKGAAGAGFDALTNGSSKGQLFGFFAPSGAATDIHNASGGHVNLIALPFPSPAGQTYASVSSDTSVAGSAKTKSPKLVASFLAYLASPAGQKALTATSGSFPVGTTDASTLSAPYKPMAQIITSRQYRGYPTIEWPNGKIYDDLGSGVQGVITGQKTAAQVLQQLDSDWG